MTELFLRFVGTLGEIFNVAHNRRVNNGLLSVQACSLANHAPVDLCCFDPIAPFHARAEP